MFANLFTELKQAGVPVSLREYLDLLEATDAGVAGYSVEDFYFLARTALVKDERHLDRFDRVFGHVFKGLEAPEDEVVEIPEEWLRKMTELNLSDEEKAAIEAMGGWEKLMETLKKRLEEQKKRHQGGSKWIGTGGTSPFGAYGYNPEGVRIGQDGNRNFSAVKVWDKREFKDLDGDTQIGTRNIKVALRRLRRFAREGAATELDIDDTIASTAKNAGWLDLKIVPERHNAVKVLLLLDIGGSMDWHVKACEELFSAASMSPYEIAMSGGSVEHYNDESGEVWLRRILAVYSRAVWLNPVPQERWRYTGSIGMIREIMEGRMFPLTLEGRDSAMRELS